MRGLERYAIPFSGLSLGNFRINVYFDGMNFCNDAYATIEYGHRNTLKIKSAGSGSDTSILAGDTWITSTLGDERYLTGVLSNAI